MTRYFISNQPASGYCSMFRVECPVTDALRWLLSPASKDGGTGDGYPWCAPVANRRAPRVRLGRELSPCAWVAPVPQFLSVFPVFSVNWILSCDFFSPHSDLNPSRSRSR